MDSVMAFIAGAWGSRAGGINALNHDLCCAVAELAPSRLAVVCVTLHASPSEVADAASRGVTLVSLEAEKGTERVPERWSYELSHRAREWGGRVACWVGHDVISGPVAVAVARQTGARSAVIQHTDYASYAPLKGRSGEPIIRRELDSSATLLRADVVLAVGPKLAAAARSMVRGVSSAGSVTEIVPGLASIDPLADPPLTFRVITFGRLDPITDRIKQAGLAVQAFGQLAREALDITRDDPSLVVVGIETGGDGDAVAGKEEEELRRMAHDRAGRAVAVIGHPFTESRDVLFEELRRATVCVMLSVHDGFGLTGWEAIAAEVPLIVSKNTGLYSLLHQRGGSAVGCVWPVDIKGRIDAPYYSEDDVAAVTAAFAAIAVDPVAAKRNARQLKQILAEYTWEHTARQLLRTLDLDDTPSPPPTHSTSPVDMRGRATLPPTNLPPEVDSFLGRKSEMEKCRSRLADESARLMTLTGEPGVGKTRFALELARSLLADFDGHVYFVDLTTVTDSSLVIATITRALRLDAGEPALEALKELFRDRRVLLVLDNFEHVQLASLAILELLHGASRLQVLATSLDPLKLGIERPYPLGPLPERDAVTLLRDRVQWSGGEVDIDEASAIELCSWLDGVPLSIELVAARAQQFSLPDLLESLKQEGDLLDLQATRPDIPAKQRSLRAASAWSYGLLSTEEQVLFRRLSIFGGGWTLQTAATVVGDPSAGRIQLIDKMSSLLDKWLVRRDSRRANRMSMLPPLRRFAGEELTDDDPDVIAALRERYCACFLDHAERAHRDLFEADQDAYLVAIQSEHENIATILDVFVDRGDAESALRVVCAAGEFWWSRDYAGGATRTANVLALPTPESARSLRVTALLISGRLNIRLHQLPKAASDFAEAQALALTLSDAGLEADALANGALVHMERGQFQDAELMLHRALEINTSRGRVRAIADVEDSLGLVALSTGRNHDAPAHFRRSVRSYLEVGDARGVAWVENDLAALAIVEERWPDANDHALKAKEVGERIGDPGLVAWSRHYLGLIASQDGRFDDAHEHHDECITTVRMLGDTRPQILAIEGFAALAIEEQRWEDGVKLAAAATELREAAGLPRSVAEANILGSRTSRAREHLSAAALAAADAAGKSLTLDETVLIARRR